MLVALKVQWAYGDLAVWRHKSELVERALETDDIRRRARGNQHIDGAPLRCFIAVAEGAGLKYEVGLQFAGQADFTVNCARDVDSIAVLEFEAHCGNGASEAG